MSNECFNQVCMRLNQAGVCKQLFTGYRVLGIGYGCLTQARHASVFACACACCLCWLPLVRGLWHLRTCACEQLLAWLRVCCTAGVLHAAVTPSLVPRPPLRTPQYVLVQAPVAGAQAPYQQFSFLPFKTWGVSACCCACCRVR